MPIHAATPRVPSGTMAIQIIVTGVNAQPPVVAPARAAAMRQAGETKSHNTAFLAESRAGGPGRGQRRRGGRGPGQCPPPHRAGRWRRLPGWTPSRGAPARSPPGPGPGFPASRRTRRPGWCPCTTRTPGRPGRAGPASRPGPAAGPGSPATLTASWRTARCTMRFAGRFARRLKAWGNANGVPVIYCKAGERKHLIAEEYLAAHEVGTGVFLVLAAKAPASVWQVSRSESSGLISNIAKKPAYVNHYSFHIMDPQWGHVTIKMSGHPPFPAQVILNGHEYVAAAARAAGIGFAKEGNCFTGIADPQGLARVADTLSRDAAIGRLGQVCDRGICTACLCFGLDLAGQARSGFRYASSIYQAEYSRNLLFRSGGHMEDLLVRILDRTRSRLDIPALRTLSGLKNRPHQNRASGPPAQEAVTGKP